MWLADLFKSSPGKRFFDLLAQQGAFVRGSAAPRNDSCQSIAWPVKQRIRRFLRLPGPNSNLRPGG